MAAELRNRARGGALDGPGGHAEQPGHLGLTAIIEIAQDDDGALLDSKGVQRPEQRRPQLDGAVRIGWSCEVTSRAMGRASLPSCSRIEETAPGGAVASINTSARPPGASTSAPLRA